MNSFVPIIKISFNTRPLWLYNIKRFFRPYIYPKIVPLSVNRRELKCNWTLEALEACESLQNLTKDFDSVLDKLQQEIKNEHNKR